MVVATRATFLLLMFGLIVIWQFDSAKASTSQLARHTASRIRLGSTRKVINGPLAHHNTSAIVSDNGNNQKIVTLRFFGGNANCSVGQCPEGQAYPNYACSNGFDGQWNNGALQFNNPIPIHNFITAVYVTLVGRFNCQILQPSAIVISTLQGETLHQSDDLPPDPYGCGGCTNCMITYKYQPLLVDSWPGYIYTPDAVNTVEIFVVQNSICLSSVILGLNYSIIEPSIKAITPSNGLIGGGTNVTVTGTNFDNYQGSHLVCRFGEDSTPVPATFVSNTTIVCVSPPQVKPSTVLLQASEDGQGFSSDIIYFTYMNPNITALVPPKGDVHGNNVVYIIGSGFINSGLFMKCKFGDVIVPATYNSPTNISCIAPPAMKTGNVSICLTFNLQQYTDPNLAPKYLYTVPGPNGWLDNLKQYIGWIVAVGIVIVFVLILLVILVWYRWRKKNNPDLEDLIKEGIIGGFSDDFEEVDPAEIEIGPRIGKGSFAEVFKAKWRGTTIAVKKLPAHMVGEEFFDDFEKEADLMKRLRHPNVLQFLGACLMPPDICILMEYMPKGSLYRILHSQVELPWDLLQRMALDAARGMTYLHCSEPQILHRDLKSHNLLVDENWKVKVCDFGLSRIVEQTLSATMTSCGTPCWTAPEVLRNDRYTEKCDVYSFGIVLWEMMTRTDPYKGMPPFQVVFAVGTQKIRPPIPLLAPSAWASLMVECWDEDPRNRPNFSDIIERLSNFPSIDEPSPLPNSLSSSVPKERLSSSINT